MNTIIIITLENIIFLDIYVLSQGTYNLPGFKQALLLPFSFVRQHEINMLDLLITTYFQLECPIMFFIQDSNLIFVLEGQGY